MNTYTGPERRKVKGSILNREAYVFSGTNKPRQTPHDYAATVVAHVPPKRTSEPETRTEQQAQRRTAIVPKPASNPETAAYVKSLRAQLGLTVVEFAKVCSVSSQTVYQWQWGIRAPSKMAMMVMETLSGQNQPIEKTCDELPI